MNSALAFIMQTLCACIFQEQNRLETQMFLIGQTHETTDFLKTVDISMCATNPFHDFHVQTITTVSPLLQILCESYLLEKCCE